MYDVQLQKTTVLRITHAAAVPSTFDEAITMRDFRQIPAVEDVKTKLSCETFLKIWKRMWWKRWMRKRSFRARLASKPYSGRCENEAFVRDLSQKVNVEDVKMKLSCETSFKIWKLKMWKRSFRVRPPSKSESWRCENKAFVRDLPQNLNAEDVKTKLSCETSLKKWKWKMWKWSCRARPLRNLKDQIVKMKPKLSVPMRGRSENDPGLNERVPQPPAGQASPSIFRGMFRPAKHGSLCIR